MEEQINFNQYTIKDLVASLKIPKSTLYQDIRSGRLIAYKKGNSYYVTESSLRKYVNSLQEASLGRSRDTTMLMLELADMMELGDKLIADGKITKEQLDRVLEPKRQELRQRLEVEKNDKPKN